MPSMRKRKRRRQGRFAPVFKLLFLVAMAAALVLGATVFFQVEHIVVTGNSRYTQQAVINAISSASVKPRSPKTSAAVSPTCRPFRSCAACRIPCLLR